MKNTIIKVLSVVMAMVMALGTCIVVTGTAAAADCKHANYEQYGDPVAATCTTWGYTVYRCSDCGDHFKTELNTLEPPHEKVEGHKWLNEKTVDATCIADGYKTRTCSVCNKEDTVKTSDKSESLHKWDEGVKTDSNCTDKGATLYTCKTCGKTKTTDIAAKGHKWVAQKDSVVAPKCEGVVTKENPDAGNGSMTYICSVCGASKEVVIKPRENHVYVDMPASVDTCTTVGHVAGKFCQWCSKPAPGVADIWDNVKHNWERVPGTEMKEATCEEDGFWTVKCTICGVVEENKVITATYHEFKDNATTHRDPTCTTWGYDLYGCIHCGKIFVNKSYEPLGHKYDNFVSDDPATCTSPAGKKFSCTNKWVDADGKEVVCGHTTIIANEGAKPLGHSDIKEVAEVPATCEKDGTKAGKKCGVCGLFVEGGETIAKLGHDIKITVCTTEGKVYEECTRAAECKYVSKTTDKTFSADATESHSFKKDTEKSIPATCTADGQDVLECRFCHKLAIEVVKATGHDIVENKDLNRAPNCTNDGYYSDICKNCGEIFNAKVLPKIADAHVGIINTELSYAATCTKDGQEVGDCGICGKPYIKVLPKLGHDLVNVPAKAPTCEEAGNKAYSYCKRTGCDLTEEAVKKDLEVEIKALGHKKVEDKAVAATCTEKGLTKGSHCSVCGKILEAQTEVAPLGHDYVKASDSCTAACGDKATIGYDHMACSRCDSEYIVKYADIPAHIWGETKKQEMTCEQDGFEYQPCTFEGCTAKNIDEKTRVAATGHVNKAGEVITKLCTRTTTDNVCVNKHCNVKDANGKNIEIKFVHNDKFEAKLDATCLMYAHELWVCTVCERKNVILTDENPKLGEHDLKEISKSDAPTFEKAQKIVNECKVCGEVFETYKAKMAQFKATVKNITNADEKVVNGTKKIQVTIAIRSDKREIHSFIGAFTFNKDHLEFIDATCSKTIAGMAASIDAYNIKADNKDTGKVNITAFVNNDADNKVVNATLTGEFETLVTLNFKVKGTAYAADAASITTSMALTIDNLVDKDEKVNKPNLDEAKPTVEIYRLGDVNGSGDGKVNNSDYLAIQKLIEADKYDARADLNGDGKVSAEDLASLQKILVARYAYNDVANARK